MPGTFHRVSSNKAIFQLALKLIYFLRKNFPYYNRCLSTRVKKLMLYGHYLKPNDLFCFSLYLAWRHLSGFCDFNSLWTFRNATVSVCCAFVKYKNVKNLKILIEFSVKTTVVDLAVAYVFIWCNSWRYSVEGLFQAHFRLISVLLKLLLLYEIHLCLISNSKLISKAFENVPKN